MARDAFLTLRSAVIGEINDLLNDEGISCSYSQNILTYLAGALNDYREEGIELSPTIIFCESIEQIAKILPGGVSYQIGSSQLSTALGQAILKDCATLSGINWHIYIERTNANELRYGVFSYTQLPTSITLKDILAVAKENFSIIVRQVSSKAVEIIGRHGGHIILAFSTLREKPKINSDPVDLFAEACCKNIVAEFRSSEMCIYFVRLISRCLASSHGTILLCAKLNQFNLIEELKDVVRLEPHLNFASVFANYITTPNAESFLRLQANEELLQGFMRSDGIVIFDDSAGVIAFRAFFRGGAGGSTGVTNVTGGARRRAFEGLKGLIGSHAQAMLFRSQDGLTLFEGVQHERN